MNGAVSLHPWSPFCLDDLAFTCNSGKTYVLQQQLMRLKHDWSVGAFASWIERSESCCSFNSCVLGFSPLVNCLETEV